jgi:hypothetical protein
MNRRYDGAVRGLMVAVQECCGQEGPGAARVREVGEQQPWDATSCANGRTCSSRCADLQ